MCKNKILSILLPLLLMLPACTAAEKPAASSVPPPVSAVSSALASVSAASSTLSSAYSTVSEASEASSTESNGISSAASSSAQSTVSRILASSSKGIVLLNSSLTPMAAPKSTAAAQKPMPPVTAEIPEASGVAVFSEQGATVDYSNAAQGYIMVKYSGSGKIKVLVYFNGGSSYYQYNITGDGAYTTLPLQSDSGSYRIRFMENISGSSYAELCSTEISATVSGLGCYAYPNQYVNYTRTSAAVTKAKSLCAKSTSNAAKVTAVYQYITANIKYDYAKASSVQSGYLPNVDSTLSSKKGICFDYSALMAAMCRSQGIPTRLVIGTASVGYHAWNEVYLNGWKRYDSTFGAAGQSVSSYTAEKYY